MTILVDFWYPFGSQNDLKIEPKTGLESECDFEYLFGAKMELFGYPKCSTNNQKSDITKNLTLELACVA